ncbi:MAG: GatB/YqeY domain-containing protein [Bacteroidales bacterium]|nr:GatB/YqeY domain-containing protein [Bacteroidales bacterium]MBS3774358.1 GatB/YqeY domain-containing protein [Bacteroidales bacterium]
MSLLEKVESEIKQALKNKQKERLEALRSVKTALWKAKTEKAADEKLSEEEEIQVLQKQLKQRKESAEIYEQQNRNELAEAERKEAEVIQEFLPRPMSDEELTEAVREIIDEAGATSMKDMGKVMGIANRRLAGKAEGKAIAGKVKSMLSGE